MLPDRFWSKVQKQDDGCWLWTASLDTDGYGGFKVGGQMLSAHRVSWEDVNGPIPLGMQLDHLCRVRNCINPDHLEIVTLQENIRRGLAGKYQSAKTHCPRGHAYTAENTIVNSGSRSCRECMKQKSREYKRKKPERARREELATKYIDSGELLTLQAAATLKGFSEERIRQYIVSGQLKALWVPELDRWLIAPEDLEGIQRKRHWTGKRRPNKQKD